MQVETDPARAAANVQDASAHEAHGAPMVRRPASERREVQRWTEQARGYEAVITLDDLDHGLPLERREQHLTICIVELAHRVGLALHERWRGGCAADPGELGSDPLRRSRGGFRRPVFSLRSLAWPAAVAAAAIFTGPLFARRCVLRPLDELLRHDRAGRPRAWR